MNLQNAAVCNAKESANLFACTDAISGDKIKALLCVLSYKVTQSQLNLVFGYDVPVTFRVEGCSKAEVHISGYYQPVGDSDVDDSDDEDEDFDEEAFMNTIKNSKSSLDDEDKIVVKEDMSGSDDSEETDSDDERVDAAFIQKMISENSKKGDAKKDADESSEEESDSEDSGSDSTEEEPVPKKAKAAPPSNSKKPMQNTTPSQKSKPQQHNTPKSGQKKQKNQKSGEKRKR